MMMMLGGRQREREQERAYYSDKCFLKFYIFLKIVAISVVAAACMVPHASFPQLAWFIFQIMIL